MREESEVVVASVFARWIPMIALAGVVVTGVACGSDTDAEAGGASGSAGMGGMGGSGGEAPQAEARSRRVEIIWDSWRVANASSVEAALPFVPDNLELGAWGFVAYYQYSDPSDSSSEVIAGAEEFVEVRDRLEFTSSLGNNPSPTWSVNKKIAEFTEYCDLGDPLLLIDLYEVDQDLADFRGELEDKAVEVGGVLAGAAAGAAVGSALPGLGTFVGGVIGGGVVLVAGWFEQWLNTDDSLGRTFTSTDPIQVRTEIYLEDGRNAFTLSGKSDSRSILTFTKNVLDGSCDGP